MFIAAISIASVLVAAFHTFAASAPHAKTIQECAALLPKGKSFKFTINGTIDTAGAKPVMHGSLNVSEAKTKSVAIGATETQSFSLALRRSSNDSGRWGAATMRELSGF